MFEDNERTLSSLAAPSKGCHRQERVTKKILAPRRRGERPLVLQPKTPSILSSRELCLTSSCVEMRLKPLASSVDGSILASIALR